MSLEQDPNQPIYFYVGWLKPGRNTYVIERNYFDKINKQGEQLRKNTLLKSLLSVEEQDI